MKSITKITPAESMKAVGLIRDIYNELIIDRLNAGLFPLVGDEDWKREALDLLDNYCEYNDKTGRFTEVNA